MVDRDSLTQAKTMRLDINYLNEVKLGETLELWTAPIPPVAGSSAIAIEGRRIPARDSLADSKADSSGQAAFRAELRLNLPV